MFENILEEVTNNLVSALEAIPNPYNKVIYLFLFTLLIIIYAICVWKFYQFISKKNILELNLGQYNKTEYPFLTKFLASILYLIEYIFILPFVIFISFIIFSTILLFLATQQEIEQILLISAVVIAAIRMASYYKRDLARDLAKMFPLMILTIFLITPGFFEVNHFVEQIAKIPSLFGNIIIYLIFIIALEFVLRTLDLGASLIFGADERKE